MRRVFSNLEEIEENSSLKPATEKDYVEIEKYLNEEIEIYFDEFNRVWTEGGIYIADLIKIED